MSAKQRHEYWQVGEQMPKEEQAREKLGEMMNDNEFLTKDLGLATSLMADGVKYLRVDKDEIDHRRLIFIFERTEDIARIQSERANGTHVVSSTHYEDCQRRLKSIIHNQ